MDQRRRNKHRPIDYIAVSNEQRRWVTNAQTKGVSNPNRTLQRKTIKIDIKYDIVRTNIQTPNNKHIYLDIEQLRENATQLRRGPAENNKIQKPIQTRNIYREINQKQPNTPEQAQTIEK